MLNLKLDSGCINWLNKIDQIGLFFNLKLMYYL